jgi:hypothetical protein
VVRRGSRLLTYAEPFGTRRPTLRRVAAGGLAMDPKVTTQLIARGRPQPLDPLTPRERQELS